MSDARQKATPTRYYDKSQETNEVYHYWRQLEGEILKHLSKLRFNEQSIIRQKHRNILYSWLVELATDFKTKHRVVELTTYILDMYLAQTPNMSLKELQGYGVAAFIISVSLIETYLTDLDDYCLITDNAYTPTQIRSFIISIIGTMRFSLWWPTPISFLRHFSYEIRSHNIEHITREQKSKQWYYAYYWLQLLHYYPLVRRLYPPSQLAAAVYFLSSLLMLDYIDEEKSFSQGQYKAELITGLSKVSGYSAKALSLTASDIFSVLKEAVKNKKYETFWKLNNTYLNDEELHHLPQFEPISNSIAASNCPENINCTNIISKCTTADNQLVYEWSDSDYNTIGEISGGVYGKIMLLCHEGYSHPSGLHKCLTQASQWTDIENPYRAGKSYNLFSDAGPADHILFEIMALKFDHPNLLHLDRIAWVSQDTKVPIMAIVPYYPQDIEQYFSRHFKRKTPHPAQIAWIAREILQGLAYLHNKGFCHRDLKPNNILYNSNPSDGSDESLKICDFGMGCFMSSPPSKNNTVVQTLWYRAPEVILGVERYGVGVDIWSLGVLLAHLASYNTRPWPLVGSTDSEQILSIFKFVGKHDDWPEAVQLPNWSSWYDHAFKENPWLYTDNGRERYPDDNLRAFIQSILICNPQKRPTATQLLTDSFLNEDRLMLLSKVTA